MMKKGKVTLEELSQKINISRTTIYKILNNKGKVSAATREKVLNAVEEYNYVPNQAAKNLALNKNYEIAFVGYTSPRTPYTLNNILKGVHWAEEELSDYGLTITCSITDASEPEEQIREIYHLADAGIDAFAIYPNQITPMRQCIDDLVDRGKQVITINKDVPDCSRHAYVGCNYYRSGMLAAEVLARMIPPGKEIAVLMGGKGVEYQDVVDRFRGLTRKMERFPTLKLAEPFIMEPDGAEALNEYIAGQLTENKRIGGIFDLTYELDLISKIVLKHNNSVRLVGFDLCDTVRNHMINHSIDAVIFQDMISQGYQGIKALFQAVREGSEQEIHLPYTKLEVVYEGNLEFYL